MSESSHSLGRVLRERRERLGLNLKEIEFDTKIRPEYITALETRNFDKLPADLYLERIVKNYAYYLGLDPKTALKLLKVDKDRYITTKQYPGSFYDVDDLGHVVEEQQFVSPFPTRTFVFTPKVIAFALTGLTTILIGAYLTDLVAELHAKPLLTIEQPNPGVVIDSNNVIVSGIAKPGSTVSINNLVVSVDQNGKFEEILFLKNGTNQVHVRAEDNGKITEKDLVLSARIPEENTIALSDKNVVVELGAEADQKSWVRVVADGNQIYEGMLDDHMVVEADKYIYLLAGNAAGVDVTYNGESRGPLGNQGEVVHQVFGTEVPAELQDVEQNDAEPTA